MDFEHLVNFANIVISD
ncbi:hypothetical protein F383_25879 [Gossypium arboreum]|uniref:Uncharacterized protein n=1 Tax=Gossypium arboreum TaxID=29729 RepID=A0A0B0MR70_GOSAR|nr:hypothetical protein F383_25879 [Gossypium arboreum]